MALIAPRQLAGLSLHVGEQVQLTEHLLERLGVAPFHE